MNIDKVSFFGYLNTQEKNCKECIDTETGNTYKCYLLDGYFSIMLLEVGSEGERLEGFAVMQIEEVEFNKRFILKKSPESVSVSLIKIDDKESWIKRIMRGNK